MKLSPRAAANRIKQRELNRRKPIAIVKAKKQSPHKTKKKKVSKKSRLTSESPDARELILLSATHLFAEKGFDGTSVRDIADRSKVNGAMISYYFGGKETLFTECLGRFAKDRVQSIELILTTPSSREECSVRLRLFFQSMLSVYSSDLPLLKMIMREMQNERKGVTQELLGHVTPIFDLVKKFLQSAIDKGLFKENTVADHLALIIMGALSHPCYAELAMKKVVGCTMKDSKVQAEYMEQFLSLFLYGVFE